MKRNYFLIAGLLIVATLIATAVVYPDLPSRVPMHWNWRGEVNRYGEKWEVFLTPALMASLVILFAVMPWISPKRFEVDTFQSTYLYIMLVMAAFIAYLHVLILWSAISKTFNLHRALLGAVFLLLALLGNVLGKVRRNFFIGVRTPWTLANEKVWDATHRFAAKVFVLAGLLGLLSMAVTSGPIIGLVIFAAAALAAVIYSLVYYKRLERHDQL